MDIQTLLEGFDKKAEVLAYVEKIKTESAIEASRKANNEAQGLRGRLTKAKGVLARFDIDPDQEDAETKAEEIYTRVKPKDLSKDPDIAKLTKIISDLQKEREAEKKELQDAKHDAYIKGTRAKVQKALLDEKALDTDLEEIIISKLELDGTEELKFKGENGKPLVEGIKDYLDAKPHFRQNTTLPGGGSSENNGQTRAVNQPTKLSASEKIAQGLKKK
jgi:hypothetical protein